MIRRWGPMAALIAGAFLLLLGLYQGLVPTPGCSAAWSGSGGDASAKPRTTQPEGLGFVITQSCEQIEHTDRVWSVALIVVGLVLLTIARAAWPSTAKDGVR